MSADEIETQALAPNEPDMMMAAMEYAKSGLRVFPVAYAPHKKAEGVDKAPPYGYSWVELATSKTNDVIEDFSNAESDFRQRHGLEPENRMVAWALGLDHFLAVDLDVPEEEWPDWVQDIIGDAVVSITKRGVHLIYKFPEGMRPGNRTTNFPTEGWGELRGHHGYIVIAGADRPGLDPQAILDAKPFPKPEWLIEANDTEKALPWPEVKAFCERTKNASRMPNKQNGLDTILATARTSDTGKGQSRHIVLTKVAALAAEEAIEGNYPYRPVLEKLHKWFAGVKPGKDREFKGVVCWAVAQAIANLDAGKLVEAPEASQEASEGVVGADEGDLNLPDEFWEATPHLAHIKQGAWSRGCSPDAVLAGVLARYSAQLPVRVQLPGDGTFDIFVINHGHSGSGKSKAGKTAARLFPGDSKTVMMDQNVGSGEGLAESFFEWVDEDGKPCGPNKKNAMKVRTKTGLHFATDEGAALQASANRMNSILIPTLCSAWMGEGIGQRLSDPTKSRMIDPMTVRVSAEIRIQTVNGWKLFQEAFASTGLSQRMVCFPAVDPKIYDRFKAGHKRPEWPGELVFGELPTFVSGRSNVMRYADDVARMVEAEDSEVHNPEWAGSPLDTHKTLSTLKIAGIFVLWDGRFELTMEDFDLATQVWNTHIANRGVLQRTQALAAGAARTATINYEVDLDQAKAAAHDAAEMKLLAKVLDKMTASIEAGEFPVRRKFSPAQRKHYDEARGLLEEDGTWPESRSHNPEGV